MVDPTDSISLRVASYPRLAQRGALVNTQGSNCADNLCEGHTRCTNEPHPPATVVPTTLGRIDLQEPLHLCWRPLARAEHHSALAQNAQPEEDLHGDGVVVLLSVAKQK